MDDQYLTSLHWVLAQFTPAPISIQPANPRERAFNVIVICFALAVMGSMVSQISATMAQLRAVGSENAKRRQQVRLYLRLNDVSLELSVRIMRFVDFSLKHNRVADLDERLLSPSLRNELVMHQRLPLTRHPLLSLLQEGFASSFSNVCAATDHLVYGKDDVVFVAGSFGTGSSDDRKRRLPA